MGAESLKASRTNLVEVEANNAKEAYHERLSNCHSTTEQGYSSISERDSPASLMLMCLPVGLRDLLMMRENRSRSAQKRCGSDWTLLS